VSTYTFQETAEKTVVKDSKGEVCLECFAGAHNVDGLVDDTQDEQAGKQKGHFSEDTNFLRHLSYWAIKKTRSALPYATFNNTMIIDGKRQYLTPKKKVKKGKGDVDCQLAPRAVLAAAETFFATLAFDPKLEIDDPHDPASKCKKTNHSNCQHKIPKPRDAVRQMAVRDFGARLSKGGVCSLISHVTMGFITTGFPEGSEAAIVYSGFDHSFCIARYKTSPWVAVDPWVMRPYALPLANILFDFASLKNNFRILIKKPVDVPYGVTFGGADPVPANELRISDKEWKAAAGSAGIDKYGDDKYFPLEKIEQELAAYETENSPIHTDHVWSHKDNLWWPRGKKKGKCGKAGVAPYGRPTCQMDCCDHGDPFLTEGYLDGISPAAGPEAWGDPKNWKPVKTMREYLDAKE